MSARNIYLRRQGSQGARPLLPCRLAGGAAGFLFTQPVFVFTRRAAELFVAQPPLLNDPRIARRFTLVQKPMMPASIPLEPSEHTEACSPDRRRAVRRHARGPNSDLLQL